MKNGRKLIKCAGNRIEIGWIPGIRTREGPIFSQECNMFCPGSMGLNISFKGDFQVSCWWWSCLENWYPQKKLTDTSTYCALSQKWGPDSQQPTWYYPRKCINDRVANAVFNTFCAVRIKFLMKRAHSWMCEIPGLGLAILKAVLKPESFYSCGPQERAANSAQGTLYVWYSMLIEWNAAVNRLIVQVDDKSNLFVNFWKPMPQPSPVFFWCFWSGTVQTAEPAPTQEQIKVLLSCRSSIRAETCVDREG